MICTCTFHSCPEIRGWTGIYCTASVNLTGRRPNFTTLPTPSPTGTVQMSPEGAFQSAKMLPIADVPAVAEEEGGDGLEVELVRV